MLEHTERLIMQASSNMMVGIAQNDCSGNTITSNTASSNQFEGITADNQANGAQVCRHVHMLGITLRIFSAVTSMSVLLSMAAWPRKCLLCLADFGKHPD
jgi:hypothetical protein